MKLNLILTLLSTIFANPAFAQNATQLLTLTNAVDLRLSQPELVLEVNYPRVAGLCGIKIRSNHGTPNQIQIEKFLKLIQVEELYKQGISVSTTAASTVRILFTDSSYKAFVRLATKDGQPLRAALDTVFASPLLKAGDSWLEVNIEIQQERSGQIEILDLNGFPPSPLLNQPFCLSRDSGGQRTLPKLEVMRFLA